MLAQPQRAGVHRHVMSWVKRRQVKTRPLEPGSPWQNTYGESFNGKFRDECLSVEV